MVYVQLILKNIKNMKWSKINYNDSVSECSLLDRDSLIFPDKLPLKIFPKFFAFEGRTVSTDVKNTATHYEVFFAYNYLELGRRHIWKQSGKNFRENDFE